MKKNIRLICFLLVAVLCFSACGGGNVDKPIEHAEDLSGSIVLGLPVGGSEGTELQAVIDAYTDIHPNVKVTLKFVETGGYKSYLETPLSAGDISKCPFDICMNNMARKYIDAGKFADYLQYLTEENPYNDAYDTWMDSLEADAYIPDGSKGEVYSLNWQSTQVRFAYNKKIFEKAGVSVGDCATWDGFVRVCDKIQKAGYTPLAIGGNDYSFTGSQMCWIFNVYTDQYFRSAAETAHAQEGDFCYDASIDSVWQYYATPVLTSGMSESETAEEWKKALYNDYFLNYTKNELRLLKAIKDDELGPVNKKYQNMLANLAKVFPKYCLANYSSYGNDNMNSKFAKQECAITLQQSYYVYNSWLSIAENYQPTDDNFFEIGFFDFPAMSANTDYADLADYGPDVNYTRSYGGSMGSWAIVNKNVEQVKLCMDFMMYLTSPQAQEKYYAMARALDVCVLKGTMIKGVTIPEDLLKGFELPVLNGIARSNPAMLFSTGLTGESYSQTAFGSSASTLFTTTPDYNDIQEFATTMQTVIKSNMFRYLRDRRYNSNCLDNVAVSPYV